MLELICDQEQTLKTFTENNYAQASFFWGQLLKSKDIKVNGKKTGSDILLQAGDSVCYYLTQKQADKPAFFEVYTDENFLIVDKESGVNAEAVYAELAASAERYLYIFTPYLILDDCLRGSLCRAALRGVDVRIVTPGIPDKKTVYRLTRANYASLQNAGVKIYEYTPGFMHAKCMLSDDERAVVGTINLDSRSLYFHFENAVYFGGSQAIFDLKRDCEETFALSKPCSLEYPKRTVAGRFIDSILRVFETLF